MSFLKKLFGLDTPTPHNPETTALLTTVYSNEELVAVRSLLEGMSIPYRWTDRGAGAVNRIVMGNNIHGTDVFVRPDQLEDAKALLFPDLSEEELAALSEQAFSEEKSDTEDKDQVK